MWWESAIVAGAVGLSLIWLGRHIFAPKKKGGPPTHLDVVQKVFETLDLNERQFKRRLTNDKLDAYYAWRNFRLA